jgi:hypothetical protein
MKAGEIEPRGRNERGELLHQLKRGEDEVGGAIGRGSLHPVCEQAVFSQRQSLERQSSARAIPAESLESCAVVGVDPGVGVQTEALEEGAASTGADG